MSFSSLNEHTDCAKKQIDGKSMEDACQYYTNHKQSTVHAEAKALVPTMNVAAAWRYETLEDGIKLMIARHRFKKPCKFPMAKKPFVCLSTI